jgi:tetratricopeptide (TPR) repeat protein
VGLLFCLGALAQSESEWAASLQKGLAAVAGGRWQEARDTLEAALAKQRFAERDPRRVNAVEVIAIAAERQGDTAYAARLYSDVLENADEGESGQRARGLALNNLGEISVDRGRWDEAAPLLEQAVALSRRVRGPNSPMTAVVVANLGTLHLLEDRLDEATAEMEQAVRILRSAAPDFRGDLVAGLSKLGAAYTQRGEYSSALPPLEEAVAIGSKSGGRDPVLGDALVRLASLFLDRGMTARAEPLLRRAVAVYSDTGSLQGMRGSGAMSKLGWLRFRENKSEEAERYFRRALQMMSHTVGPAHIGVAEAEVNLAMADVHVGSYREAGELLAASHHVLEESSGESRTMGRWLCAQAQLQARLNNRAEADLRFREAIATFEKTAGPTHPATAEALLAYAAFLQPGRKREAGALQSRAAAILSLRRE